MFVMWTVLQGAGFANSVWNAALNYIQANGAVFTPPTAANGTFDQCSGHRAGSTSLHVLQSANGAKHPARRQKSNSSGNSNPTFVARAQNFPSFQPAWDIGTTRSVSPVRVVISN